MLRINARTWLCGILMGLALVLLLALNAGATAPHGEGDSPRASLNRFVVTDALPGAVYAQGGLTSSPQHQIVGARMPTAGPLSYEDLKRVEAKARELLTRNKAIRESISPHNDRPDFEALVLRFDYTAGFSRDYNETLTLQEVHDIADSELRRARDMYAYLAVYADEARFRDDLADCLDPPPVEDPFADPPVIDPCNFPARMRESLREAAYLRMIFGQQFTADVLGFTFTSEMVGGEDFVRDEVRKLEMAVEQFQLAREAVAEGLDHYLGNGCYVYSFYTEAEWALLSRAVEGLERARHHAAVRRSYLAPDAAGLPAAQAEAQNTYRAAAMDQYIDLIMTANLATGEPACERGARPDNDMVAKMVADMLTTRQSAREMGVGRNIFGFDVSFTPAFPYLTASGSTDTGLWDRASDLTDDAEELEDQVREDERWFDWQAGELRNQISLVKTEYDNSLAALTGCSKSLPDAEFFDCVDTAADRLRTCDPTQASAAFDACVAATGVAGQMKEEWQNLQKSVLAIKRVQQALENLAQREVIEMERNATVNDALLTNGVDQAAMEFFATLLDAIRVHVGFEVDLESLVVGPTVSVEFENNPFQPVIAALRSAQILRQAVADIEIGNANSEAVVRNLLLDAVELQIDLEIAAHNAKAQITVFENLAAGTQDLAVEARRARAYAEQHPANDPSYRLIRDSQRLMLADRLALAARVSYLAARRAEYEYAARLSASGLRISDIYRARTAGEIRDFLNKLALITDELVLDDAEINREVFALSVAQHLLGWTDEELGLTGEAARAERIRLFREWVAENTETGTDGKPVLVFSIATSAADNGILSNVIAQGFDWFWLHMVSGVGQPKDESEGLGVDLITAQTDDLRYRRVVVKQSGIVYLKARSGCIFEYHLVHPAPLLGLEWPEGAPLDVAPATFLASVNGENGTRTAAFLGRPVSSTDWEVEVKAGAPETGLPDMDLQQLEDIVLVFDSTHATRLSLGVPHPSECVRTDY
jgi:hypothetical protein